MSRGFGHTVVTLILEVAASMLAWGTPCHLEIVLDQKTRLYK